MNGFGRFDGPVKNRSWGWLLIGLLLLLPIGQPVHSALDDNAPAAAAAGGAPEGAEKMVAIDFNDVDINVFIKFMSELTGKNFVVDNRVRGKVTIISPAKISIEEAYQVFESVLEVHGYATVTSGEIIKIVPSPEARSKSIETRIREEAGPGKDRVITQLIPLKYADPNEIKQLFTPMVSKNSVILSYVPTNMLIVTDVESNINRLLRILRVIDVTGMGHQIVVVPLEYADANKMITLLTTVFQERGRVRRAPGAPDDQTVKFVADERTNSIVLLASEVEAERIKKLIALLDRETPRDKGNIRVYYLEFATAEELAAVLRELPSKGAGATEGQPTAPIVSDKVRITADKATNSLIIMADPDDYLVLEEIIRKLDIPRSMVYIEALLMEVNVDKALDFGVEWSSFGKTTVNERSAVFGGGFRSGGTRLGGGEGQLPIDAGSGFSLGIISEPITVGDFTFSNISALVQAVRTDDAFHILSTPQILTTDNEEASITVGENRPFQTTTSTSDNDTFNSFEYRDVGKILTITPHISEGRMVRLKIDLEVTNVTSATTSLQPVTSKRTVTTTVIVDDGNTVVLGGLIDDLSENAQTSVPCLGDIPGLKYLFSSVSINTIKTNLYVFLTPHVVKSPAEADSMYRSKKDQIDKVRKEAREASEIKLYERLLNQKAPVVPDPQAKPPEGTTP
ncbi:MAG: type II secretion system secretin GspD [Desulfobacteraceae bacterium]|nr:type II secretion system secretin GspD [Desulfobacteraceae bacterium]